MQMSQQGFLLGEQLPLDSWFKSAQTSKENLLPSRSVKRKRQVKATGQEQGDARGGQHKDVSTAGKQPSRRQRETQATISATTLGLQTPSTTQRPKPSTLKRSLDSGASRRATTLISSSRTIVAGRSRATPIALAAEARLPTPETAKRPTKRMPARPTLQPATPQTPTGRRHSLHLSSSLSDMPSPTSSKNKCHSPKVGHPHSTPQSQRIVPCSQHSGASHESETVLPSQGREEANPFIGQPTHSPSARNFELPLLSSPITESNRSVSVPQRDTAFKLPPLPLLHTSLPKAQAQAFHPQSGSMVNTSPNKDIVPSSQSQYLPSVPFSASGSRSISSSSPHSGREDSYFVPTSQSQEEELPTVRKLDWGISFPSASSTSGQTVGRTEEGSGDVLPGPIHSSPQSQNPNTTRNDTPKGKYMSRSLQPEPGSPGQRAIDSSQTEPDDWPSVQSPSRPSNSKDSGQAETTTRDASSSAVRMQNGTRSKQQGTYPIEDDSVTESESDDDLVTSGYRYRKAPRLQQPSVEALDDASGSRGTSINPRFSTSLRISRKKLRTAPRVIGRLDRVNAENAASTGFSVADSLFSSQSVMPSSYIDLEGSLPSAVGDFLKMVGSDGSSLDDPSTSKTQG